MKNVLLGGDCLPAAGRLQLPCRLLRKDGKTKNECLRRTGFSRPEASGLLRKDGKSFETSLRVTAGNAALSLSGAYSRFEERMMITFTEVKDCFSRPVGSFAKTEKTRKNSPNFELSTLN